MTKRDIRVFVMGALVGTGLLVSFGAISDADYAKRDLPVEIALYQFAESHNMNDAATQSKRLDRIRKHAAALDARP